MVDSLMTKALSVPDVPTRDKSAVAKAQEAVRTLLKFIGEDPSRDGLRDTPRRVVESLVEMTTGYGEDAASILGTSFRVTHDEIILLSGIRFSSLCEHHMLPFQGEAHVAYIPNPRSERGIIGISKLARVVEMYARRLQVQERMTDQVADAILEALAPKGVAVIVKAHHECMGCRGVLQPSALMTTSAMRGVFRDDPAARAELMSLIREAR
jgi:GTP cyclohydrolase I